MMSTTTITPPTTFTTCPTSPRIDEEVGAFLQETYDPDPKVRKLAVHHLCPCGVKRNIPAVWERLLAMIGDVDAGVRGQVLHNLCDGSPRTYQAQVLRAIESLHDDPDPGLRRRARKFLAQYRRSGRINVL